MNKQASAIPRVMTKPREMTRSGTPLSSSGFGILGKPYRSPGREREKQIKARLFAMIIQARRRQGGERNCPVGKRRMINPRIAMMIQNSHPDNQAIATHPDIGT